MPTYEPLTDAQRAWLADQLRHAARLVGSDDPEALPSLQDLDRAWDKFLALGASVNDRANQVVLCVGVAFGEHLVRELGFSWCISTDDWGADFAVVASKGREELLIFPTDFVSKRWETKTTDFLVDAIEQIKEMLFDAEEEFLDADEEGDDPPFH